MNIYDLLLLLYPIEEHPRNSHIISHKDKIQNIYQKKSDIKVAHTVRARKTMRRSQKEERKHQLLTCMYK